MAIKKVLVAALIVSALVWNIGVKLSEAVTTQYQLSGRVYRGETGIEPPNSAPIEGVTVRLYCSNNKNDLGNPLRSTVTSEDGWYSLDVNSGDICEYYNIVETNLPNYISNGATTVDGSVVTVNWIQYQFPLSGKTLTGNKFWDELGVLSGRVFEGEASDESTPLPGAVVSLYCSNNSSFTGNFLRSTVTDESGWFGLDIHATDTCEYFEIIEDDPPGYFSVGASTVGGNVITANWTEYAVPLEGKALTGNKFWDKTNHVYLPLAERGH